jgi:hypothetical protein
MELHLRHIQGTIRISPEDTTNKPHHYKVNCHGAYDKDRVETQYCSSTRSAAGAGSIHATNHWSPFCPPQLLGSIR